MISCQIIKLRDKAKAKVKFILVGISELFLMDKDIDFYDEMFFIFKKLRSLSSKSIRDRFHFKMYFSSHYIT